ncbi:BadF/BadG/BcrA/BcrD ATPase family protein [Mesorhizobium sp. LHD-90]|uniref:N-acetylglucosamine kinase n=1 Tax=Mesorhizobium sp. LHD-90 TaxID=3071414 RepID=UPI0027E18C52|nr:BadF/BadG/BcrA/BcrD ATPase family protein [Mesorhizobium sp. LHD-90]MDQ6433833.1 BadF/BadG/BcrA/BcrD ATPase family protein [Mesorhizobium sp. LHD-90]
MTALGIDIGGTKTHLRFYDPAGAARDLVLPSAEWRLRDWDKDAVALLGIAQNFAGDIAALAVGAHGCDDAAECEAFQAAFARHAKFPVTVVNDAELLPAALGYEHQIGLVAGTGSIAVCRDAKVGMLVAGGWGWVIGDEGSASGLMREAARTISLHLDSGGSMAEPLVELMFEALSIPSAARIGSVVARQGGAAALGKHAPVLFEAERRGSLLARQVIRDGARHLADLVARLKRNGAEADVVVAGGGVIVAQQSLANAFLDEISRRYGGAMTARIYTGPPVEGACRLAAKLAGHAEPPAAIGRPAVSS